MVSREEDLRGVGSNSGCRSLRRDRSAMVWAAVFILIAVLFNPILPIRLHRSIWFYLDLMAAGAFAAHWIFVRYGEMASRLKPWGLHGAAPFGFGLTKRDTGNRNR